MTEGARSNLTLTAGAPTGGCTAYAALLRNGARAPAFQAASRWMAPQIRPATIFTLNASRGSGAKHVAPLEGGAVDDADEPPAC